MRLFGLVLLFASFTQASTARHPLAEPVFQNVAYAHTGYESMRETAVFSGIERQPCAKTTEPEPLSTPGPLGVVDSGEVVISYIIGIDGRVDGVLVMESVGTKTDQAVVRAVKQWRFRPAKCNGIPFDTEGRTSFTF